MCEPLEVRSAMFLPLTVTCDLIHDAAKVYVNVQTKKKSAADEGYPSFSTSACSSIMGLTTPAPELNFIDANEVAAARPKKMRIGLQPVILDIPNVTPQVNAQACLHQCATTSRSVITTDPATRRRLSGHKLKV